MFLGGTDILKGAVTITVGDIIIWYLKGHKTATHFRNRAGP